MRASILIVGISIIGLAVTVIETVCRYAGIIIVSGAY